MKFYYLSAICCVSLALHAQTKFNELNDALQHEDYAYILGVFEQEQQPNIIKKRLLTRMLQQWNNLSAGEQKRTDALVAQLMPADRMVLAHIKKRSLEIDTKKADRADSELAEATVTAPWQENTPAIATPTMPPPTVEKKQAPKKQTQKAMPKKSTPQPGTKKATLKKPAPKKQMPAKKRTMTVAEPVVAPAPKVIIKEVPAPTPVKDEL